jgi:uncharacterized protein with von Willebrand factor type A (vWA) domain
MNKKDLLAALEIAPAPVTDTHGDTFDADTPAAPTTPASDTALDLDKWSLRRGTEAAAGEVLGPLLAGRDDAEIVAADMLGAAFEPSPQLAERCIDPARGRFMRALLESDEYRSLHADTALDPVASELAAGHFTQGYVASQHQDDQQQPEGGSGGQSDEIRQEMDTIRQAGAAVRAAAEDVGELRDAERALGDGFGLDGGKGTSSVDVLDRFKRIQGSPRMRRIMSLAGRYRRTAQAKQRQKTLHGRDDVVGVELGADLGRVVPTELAALVDEDLEWASLRRMLEHGLQCREYRGIEPHGKGPIVVIVDESGSMDGPRIETAKAFALAMGWIARHQNRWLCLVGFSGTGEQTMLAISPSEWRVKQEAVFDWVAHFFCGGTDYTIPLQWVPSQWDSMGCPEGKTDIVLITDATANTDRSILDSFNAWKQQTHAKLYSIVIDDDDAGCLASVSDKTWTVPDLSLGNEAIEDCLSI